MYRRAVENPEVVLVGVRFTGLFGHIGTIRREPKLKGTPLRAFRSFAETMWRPTAFIDRERIPYREAPEAIRDHAFPSSKRADEIDRVTGRSARIANSDR